MSDSQFAKMKIPKDLIPSDPRFGCGPSLIPVSRLEGLTKTGQHLLGTSHRQTAIKDLVGEIIQGLRVYFEIPSDYDVVLGNGGATFLFDMIPLTMVDKKTVHFTCGEFSQKWFQTAKKIPWITAEEKSAKMGEGISPTDIPGAGVDMIAVTLNETSTGVQLDQLPTLDRKESEKLLAVDATSGAGQIPCKIGDTDVFYFSPQKVLASEGGLWVAFLSPRAVKKAERLSSQKDRFVPEIMRLDYALDNSRKNQTYNTPAITTLYFLNEQLKEMNVMGNKQVYKLAENKAELLYSWAEKKEYLSPFIKDKKFRSQSVATIDVDERVELDPLLNYLMKEKLVYGIEGYRKLGRNQLRISLFHSIRFEDLQRLTELLSFLMENILSSKK